MAIRVNTNDPQGLLDAINEGIEQGHIKTWQYDVDGDFTHTPQQFVNRAWMRPYVRQGSLWFGIVRTAQTKITVEIYAIYHGRFIEMLLAHFDSKFTNVSASPLFNPDYDVYLA